MLQPIELLKKELAELRVVANRRRFSKLKREANELIPAYENSIKILEKVNDADTSHEQALHKHNVIKSVCDCGGKFGGVYYGAKRCSNCGKIVPV